jgi:CHAT domain-containing protein
MSLWTVDDNATKNLMESFYKEQRANKNYVKSLKEAKLQMIHQNLHPFFWAPFVISGK